MKRNKAQTFLAYVALFAIITGALVMMAKYFTRTVQGKMKDSSDVFGGGGQYEPGITQTR